MGEITADNNRGRSGSLSERDGQVAGPAAQIEDPQTRLEASLGSGATAPTDVEIETEEVVEGVVAPGDFSGLSSSSVSRPSYSNQNSKLRSATSSAWMPTRFP